MPPLRLLLGVSSSIAAHRALDVASAVVKAGGQVRAVLTPDTVNLVGPAAFDAICGTRTITTLWGSGHEGEMDHLAATKWANVFAVAPCTAGTLAKLALGLADDALSTFAIAWHGPLVVAPAMNPAMFSHPTVQDHLVTLQARGAVIVGPEVGRMACGDEGIGRLACVDEIVSAISTAVAGTGGALNLRGEHILITSGPTREFIDPVRCLTNPSTGRMGVSLARAALAAGAQVTLVTGPTELAMPAGLEAVERIVTAEEMKTAVLRALPNATCAIFAAAVSDWRPAKTSDKKEKKEGRPAKTTLALERTTDVALAAGALRNAGQFFIGFAAETDRIHEHAREKLKKKRFDLVVANPVNEAGSGFGVPTNRATLIAADGTRELPLMTKDALAIEILREFAKRRKRG